MNIKVWIKANIADKALSPLRNDLLSKLGNADTVLDIGCGTGDLLFKLANTIQSGHGVDLNKSLIDYARNKCQEAAISNLNFYNADAKQLNLTRCDIATSTLCLHELPYQSACALLVHMAKASRRVVIADYQQPKTLQAKLGTELDEMISGHYLHFRRYRRAGYIPDYAQACGLQIESSEHSSIDGIVIWQIAGELKSR